MRLSSGPLQLRLQHYTTVKLEEPGVSLEEGTSTTSRGASGAAEERRTLEETSWGAGGAAGTRRTLEEGTSTTSQGAAGPVLGLLGRGGPMQERVLLQFLWGGGQREVGCQATPLVLLEPELPH